MNRLRRYSEEGVFMRFAIALLALIVSITTQLCAQVTPAVPALEAPTKLEALEFRKGTLIIKGYTEVGRVDGEDGSSITVSAIEIKDSGRGVSEMGLAIVAAGGGEARRSAISYVDFDEIAGLLSALDSLGKPDPDATRLSAYEAQFRTRSNLEFVSFDSNNQRMISVKAVQVIFPSGEVTWSTAQFRLSTLASIRKQLVDAKDLLDKLREGAAK
jgi:hypothetical protein